jgi:hypothetical protein
MSEQGWQDFLAAENGGDWVVLHGGATAVFRCLSRRPGGGVLDPRPLHQPHQLGDGDEALRHQGLYQ